MNIKWSTGKYEIIDSKILNVLDNEFFIDIDDITFRFGFMDTDEFKGGKIAASKEPEGGIYTIAICNFDFDGLQGFFEPMPLGVVGGVQYYYNFSGWSIPGKEYSVVILNILKEMDNARHERYCK